MRMLVCHHCRGSRCAHCCFQGCYESAGPGTPWREHQSGQPQGFYPPVYRVRYRVFE